MTQAERRELSEHILRDAFGEPLPGAGARAGARPGAGRPREEEDEDWPSELHPLHFHPHER